MSFIRKPDATRDGNFIQNRVHLVPRTPIWCLWQSIYLSTSRDNGNRSAPWRMTSMRSLKCHSGKGEHFRVRVLLTSPVYLYRVALNISIVRWEMRLESNLLTPVLKKIMLKQAINYVRVSLNWHIIWNISRRLFITDLTTYLYIYELASTPLCCACLFFRYGIFPVLNRSVSDSLMDGFTAIWIYEIF